MKKKGKNKKSQALMRRRVALIIVIIAIILLIKGIVGAIFKTTASEEISFLLNNEIVELINEMYIDENNVIYLSKDDVEKIFDETIYYNEAEGELITTYNKHIAVLNENENYMVVNDSNVEIQGSLVEKSNEVYLPISEMGIVYDLEFEYAEETNIVIADSTSNAKSQALLIKNTSLKEKNSIFSNKIKKLERGIYLVIIEEGEKYSKVRTTDGYIGYVKTKKLGDVEVIREELEEEEISVNVLNNASDISGNYKNSKLSTDKTNVAIPTFFYVETDSTVLDKTSSTTSDYQDYISWAEESGVEIWATLSNNAEVSNNLNTYTKRNKIINELYKLLVEYQFSGININFEKIDDVNSFYRFVIELTPRLKELGIRVAVTSNSSIDTDKISNIVDLIIE